MWYEIVNVDLKIFMLELILYCIFFALFFKAVDTEYPGVVVRPILPLRYLGSLAECIGLVWILVWAGECLWGGKHQQGVAPVGGGPPTGGASGSPERLPSRETAVPSLRAPQTRTPPIPSPDPGQSPTSREEGRQAGRPGRGTEGRP